MKFSKPILIMLIFALLACNNDDTKGSNESAISDYEKTGRLISVDKAKRLGANFKRQFVPVIAQMQNDIKRQNSAYEPTEYAWISIKELKAYIAFLEEVERKNANQPKVSGIALNFGAYDKSYKTDKPGDYRNRLTLVFTPTYKDKSIKSKFELLKHKQFYVLADSKKDKYKGAFKAFDGSVLSKNSNKMGSNFSDFILNASSQPNGSHTSLSSNELNVIPPN